MNRTLASSIRRRAASLVRPREVRQDRIHRYLEQMRRVPRPDLRKCTRDSVSIIIPCYGHAEFLGTMLESISRQTRLPDEVVFVVDASPDDTEAVLTRLIRATSAAIESRCRLLVNERNIGQAASLNRGIAATSCDVVMILNDDDYLMHDAVEISRGLLADHLELALLGAGSVHFRGDTELAAQVKTIRERTRGSTPTVRVTYPVDVLKYRRYNDLNMTHSGSTFLRDVWVTVGGYQAERRLRVVPFSDRDFQLRVNAVFPVGVTDDAAFSFWRADSSVDHGVNS